jgi:peptidoglycan/LPS O-acetylase OafA/YrhL
MFVFQKQVRFDKQIGELSYPIYICHMLVFDLTTMALAKFSMDKGVAANVAKLVAVIVVAYCLNCFVAEPVERLRRQFRRPVLASNG